jgi:hypothetical protein
MMFALAKVVDVSRYFASSNEREMRIRAQFARQ